jgi:hypothetical protein
MPKLNIPGGRPGPVFTEVKSVRLTEETALALTELAEEQDVDDSAVLRFALTLIPGWDARVKRARLMLKAKP